jgi:spore coat protein U-like protein
MQREREAVTVKGALVGLVVLVGILHASEASAQSPSCTISATSVNFGNYNVFNGTNLDSTGRITYRCNATAANITIGLTKGLSSTFNPRLMSKGAEVLGYNLYRNAARTNIWGDGTSGTAVYTRANPPNNSNVNVTVYGRVPAGQDVSAGTFSDTVTAVINF